MGKRKFYLVFFTTASLLLAFPFFKATVAREKTTDENIPKLLAPGVRTSDNFPCSKCHTYRPVNRTKRKLELYHTDKVLKHAEQQRWCHDCHEGDKLRLQNGRLIDFEKSYYLCGQCHGTIYRDWKAGIHGKRTGLWNGEKLYRLCVNCHDPHEPRFKPVKPEAPPARPEDIKPGRG